MTELPVVVADHRIMGKVRRDRLALVHDDRPRPIDAANSLSPSMPLVAARPAPRVPGHA